MSTTLIWAGLAVLVAAQVAVGALGIANSWQWGHNGYNGAAYQVAARNTLRFGELFPVQYKTGFEAPAPSDIYTHAPLGLHLSTVAALAVLGDHESSVRVVPAINGVLALLALIWLVRRRWGPLHALVTATLYVLLPINHIFANMVNHSTGMIAWSLLALGCHIEWTEAPAGQRRWPWLLGLFGATFLALNWDWPAYYVAFGIAVRWFYVALNPERRLSRPAAPELGLLAAFSAFVLANFASFMLLAYRAVGSFDEMKRGFVARHSSPDGASLLLWERVLDPLFSLPLLLLLLGWLIGLAVRHATSKAKARDLVVLVFFAAAVTHTLLFKTSAYVHIYWVWPLNPAVAIAGASGLLWLGAQGRPLLSRVSDRLPEAVPRWGGRVLTVSLIVGFLSWWVPKMVEVGVSGRRHAGSLYVNPYNSDKLKLAFAREVKVWTNPTTTVLIDRKMPWRVEFSATLDRKLQRTSRLDRALPRKQKGSDGYVLVGQVRGADRRQLLESVARHPYRQYGLYYMVDFRQRGRDIKVWNLWESPNPSLMWRLFHDPFEGPLEPTRDAASEGRWRVDVAKLAKKQSP